MHTGVLGAWRAGWHWHHTSGWRWSATIHQRAGSQHMSSGAQCLMHAETLDTQQDTPPQATPSKNVTFTVARQSTTVSRCCRLHCCTVRMSLCPTITQRPGICAPHPTLYTAHSPKTWHPATHPASRSADASTYMCGQWEPSALPHKTWKTIQAIPHRLCRPYLVPVSHPETTNTKAATGAGMGRGSGPPRAVERSLQLASTS